MSLADTLALVVGQLDRAGIDHMVAGSVASTHHGEPRTTQDIDLVIDTELSQLVEFVDSFDLQRFYLSDAVDAYRRRSKFNLIDTTTGWKVDLIIRSERPFSLSEFERRQPVTILGTGTYVATVEDTILAKLEWARLGGSDRQRRDVVAMLSIQRDTIDHDYLDLWAAELGVEQHLAAARVEADELTS